MKICFWGNVAGALKGHTDGGGELQMSLFARTLARSGHEVTILDFMTEEDFVSEDGIRVLRIKGWNKGIRILRTLTHRLPQLYKSFREQNADIYCCRVRDFRHILAFWAARKLKAKFILNLASDLDAMNFYQRIKYQYLLSFKDLWSFSSGLLIEIVYPYLLRKADLILVQHEGQKKILMKKHIKSTLFPNLIDVENMPNNVIPVNNEYIYVGSLKARKGFAKFFELVEKTPHCNYKVVGQPSDNEGHFYFEKLKGFKNVSLLGRLKHYDTLCEIAKSKALISTSPMEGFPNVFIEAWACGIPVLSLIVDPGDIIEKEQLGFVAHGDMNSLISIVNSVDNNSEYAERTKRYVENNHAINNKKTSDINSMLVNLWDH